jgi:hypothetical protein
VTLIGAGLTVILLVVGVLAMVGYTFTSNNVRTQLAQQDVYFPTKAEFASAGQMGEVTIGMKPYLMQYAGQQLLTGAEAEAYADHFIAVHLSEMSGGKTYAQISTEVRAMSTTDPNYKTMYALEQTMFQGNTLRGLLLEAYAFGTMGQIALIGSIAAFAGAALMLLLTLLGVRHLRKTDDGEMI